MKRVTPAALALAAASALAQEDAVVVTATRVPQPSLEIPASVDRIYADEIRQGRPQVNLSESLGRVPGIVVQNRQNYAQDLQVSSRGFGARATFGVRGIRLIADGIPATMPDGQGQASTFSLGSAERIEVLRGPFSALYGNAAGGVIAVETEDPPATPTVEPSLFLGSYDTWKAGVRFGGYNFLGELSRFETEGYRQHSAATRDQLNAKMNLGPLTLVVNALRQPDSQDPGGLTRAQFESDPRQASPTAEPFNTRKTVDQDQAGVRLQHRLGGTSSLEAMVYGGQREVRQFLGFRGDSPFTPLSSGGVVDLDRSYGGAALRFFINPDEAWRFSVGAEYERMDERRRGFVNDNGVEGALLRDEDDVVDSTDLFAQAEWRFAGRWSAHGGLRTSRVEFRVDDHFIGGINPDDSGAKDYSATTPVAGLVFRPTKLLSVYGNVGRGFETPTFAELAHQNAGSGPNFALEPAKSRHAELGAKTVLPGRARVNLALFDIEVKDEIVVDVNASGRTTFKNAGRTERRGVELAAETLLRGPWKASVSYTRMDAAYKDAFTSITGGATVTTPAGNLIPGIPRSQAYASLGYQREAYYAQLEALRRSRVAVNDANSQFADAYTVANVVFGLVQRGEKWRLTEFVRIDNLGDRDYAGSVIVNEGNLRFYEPAPGRSYLLGVQATLQF